MTTTALAHLGTALSLVGAYALLVLAWVAVAKIFNAGIRAAKRAARRRHKRKMKRLRLELAIAREKNRAASGSDEASSSGMSGTDA